VTVFDSDVFTVTSKRRYKPLTGPPQMPLVHDVRWSDDPPHKARRLSGVKKLGLDYERRVHDVLAAIYTVGYTPSPIIRYRVRDSRRAAIPDGILWLKDEIIVIEVKLAHTELVWEQLVLRYAALVRVLEPRRRVRTVEICRSYDPAIVLPGPHELIDSLHRAGRAPLEVLRWKI
jgi:hypothetical protein